MKCSTKVEYVGPTNCVHGYPASINLSHYDFLYDFNSMYPYDASHFEGLAWAAPERMQYIYHAQTHTPRKVAAIVPITQHRWTRGIVWALKKMGIVVDEYSYDSKSREKGSSPAPEPWLHESDKWIGITQGCRAVCKPCFRALTLAAFKVQAPAVSPEHLMGSHCRDTIDHPLKLHLENLPLSSIDNIESEPVLHSTMRKKLHRTKQIECSHVLLIVRLDPKRAMVYPPDPSLPPLDDHGNRHTVRDLRIIDVFKSRFGANRVKVYFGNTSTEEQLSLFSNACAIVGPGGAAFGNVLFAQPYTYILELYSCIPHLTEQGQVLVRYESNVEAALGTGVTWDIYRVGLDKITMFTPPYQFENVTQTLEIMGNGHVLTRIGYESNFVLSMRDYHIMVNTTCSNVKHLSSHMVC